jgi:hypothetical protein
VFDTDIVSEYEPQYWGFETQEEWDAWEKKRYEVFYIEIMKYVRGEPNNIRPGTIGMYEAEIAKTLIAKDPAFLFPLNKDKLLKEMRSIYEREHNTETVTLSPQDIALANMVATHEDDLPSA